MTLYRPNDRVKWVDTRGDWHDATVIAPTENEGRYTIELDRHGFTTTITTGDDRLRHRPLTAEERHALANRPLTAEEQEIVAEVRATHEAVQADPLGRILARLTNGLDALAELRADFERQIERVVDDLDSLRADLRRFSEPR